jgi:hypothetical protein
MSAPVMVAGTWDASDNAHGGRRTYGEVQEICKRAYRLCERDVCMCARNGDGADADAYIRCASERVMERGGI